MRASVAPYSVPIGKKTIFSADEKRACARAAHVLTSIRGRDFDEHTRVLKASAVCVCLFDYEVLCFALLLLARGSSQLLAVHTASDVTVRGEEGLWRPSQHSGRGGTKGRHASARRRWWIDGAANSKRDASASSNGHGARAMRRGERVRRSESTTADGTMVSSAAERRRLGQ
jgi:hypothetical protein